MNELPISYLNTVASQLIIISSLLCGFSLSLIFILSDKAEMNRVYKTVTISTLSFLISIFASTKILMATTKGAPVPPNLNDLLYPRIVGTLTFFIGLISIIVVIILSSWNKPKKTKYFVITLGIIALLLILSLSTSTSVEYTPN